MKQREILLPHFFACSYDELRHDLGFTDEFIQKIYKRGKDHFFDFKEALPQLSTKAVSIDGTIKYLFELSDQKKVESVFIPFYKRDAVCLSTQVGCPLKCSFCATGMLGFKRNLNPEEIVGQYLYILGDFFRRSQKENPLPPNIVFMGQGEPLLNLDNVTKAINLLTHSKLLHLGPRQITLSTSGYLPGIQEVVKRGENFPRINFALSLHSPFDEERNVLIPLNERFPLKDVLRELDKLPLLKRQFITIEYLILKGVNHSLKHAEELVNLLRPMQEKGKIIINLIPFNEVDGISYERPAPEDVEWFKEQLVAAKYRVMIRTSKGRDIAGACGQLASQEQKKDYLNS